MNTLLFILNRGNEQLTLCVCKYLNTSIEVSMYNILLKSTQHLVIQEGKIIAEHNDMYAYLNAEGSAVLVNSYLVGHR